MGDLRGSGWRKWDLHVHTPDSIEQQYAGADAWERFIVDLEQLPPEFKVLGINDYIFVDGYKKVQGYKSAGRLKNIDLLLPVVELRLNQFGGTDGALSRINFHVLFSDEIGADTIQDQFLSSLTSAYELSPQYVGKLNWKAAPTRKSIADLGQLIRDSVPKDRLKDYGSPLEEGFRNLNFKLDQVKELLDRHYFRHRYLTAVGKTEWADLKWTNQSVAEKKNLINSVDMVFMSAATVESCIRSRDKLRAENVNSKLLDCSDAHAFSSSAVKDRIGKCFTWIKGDTSFSGLTHALKEYDERVELRGTPAKVTHANSNRTKYIDTIEIRKNPGSELRESWFDDKLPLNIGLVAVIGNKGSGKSALTDTIALLGNSHHTNRSSFLNERRFRSNEDALSKHFAATLGWCDGTKLSKNLSASVDTSKPEYVRYIPQNFLEDLCNMKPGGSETDFDKELKKVIFSHVADGDRLETQTLDDLIALRHSQTAKTLQMLRSETKDLNAKIIALEDQASPEAKKKLEGFLQAKQAELTAHEASRPAEVQQPATDLVGDRTNKTITSRIAASETERDQLTAQITSTEAAVRKLAQRLAAADRLLARLDNLTRTIEAFALEATQDLATTGLTIAEVAQATIKKEPVLAKRDAWTKEKAALELQLNGDDPNSLVAQRRTLDQLLITLRQQLDAPNQQYQAYRAAIEVWEKKRQELIGAPTKVGSIEFLKKQVSDLGNLPAQLKATREQRTLKVRETWTQLSDLATHYRQLYAPVQKFIERHPIAKNKLNLRFEVSIVQTGFMESFLPLIDHRVAGSFCGALEAEAALRSLFDTSDFNTQDNALRFVDRIEALLGEDARGDETPRPKVLVASQLKKREKALPDLYDLIYSLEYLAPRYVLRLGDKELHQLSPGEKGALLLIFYLLVDGEDIPLVIDQPEENLDNHTVFDLLVPSIKDARQRRQIIIVTHNPNLAVVCDAEQVIHATLDKAAGNRIKYKSGSIEHPDINKAIVDVLEGTMPAFQNRDDKYMRGSP